MFVPSPGSKSYRTLMIEVYQHFIDNPYDDTVLFVEWPMVYDRTVNKYPYRARVTNIRTACNNLSRQLGVYKENWLWTQRDNQLWVRYVPIGTDLNRLTPNDRAFTVEARARRARSLEIHEKRRLHPGVHKNFLGEYKPIKVQKRTDNDNKN
jgi:hypothetical protein